MGRSGHRYPGTLGRYGEDEELLLPDEYLREEPNGFEEDVATEVAVPLAEQETRPIPELPPDNIVPLRLEVVPYRPRPGSSPLPHTRTATPSYSNPSYSNPRTTTSALAHRPQAHQVTPTFRGYVPSTRPLPELEPTDSPVSRQWVGAVVVVASLTGLVLLAMVAGVVAAG